MKNLFYIIVVGSLGLTSLANAADRQITVLGNCLKSVQPDRGSLDFYAESLNMDAEKALKDATKNFENARDVVKKMNLKNLELSTLENSVQEERSWENNKSVFKGYRARIGLRVYTSEIAKLGEVVTKVSKSGIKNVGSLQTDLSPAKLKEEQESCLAIAIDNAKSKADRMAKAAGAKVGKVIAIQEEGSANGIPQPKPIHYAKTMAMSAEAADGGASIDTKSESLSTSVRVTYSLD